MGAESRGPAHGVSPYRVAPTENHERMLGLTTDRASAFFEAAQDLIQALAGGTYSPEIVAAAENLNQCGETVHEGAEFYLRGKRS